MLKKIYRLTEVSLKSPKNITTPYFSIKSAKNNLEVSRFAFVVSKKVDKRAVVRNSVKRKLRSCVEEIFDRIENGNDFIFYPSQKAISSERGLILKEVESTFQKQGYLKND